MSSVTIKKVYYQRFWLGFFVGVFFMALTDLGDFHVCVGQCDNKGISLWELFEEVPAKKTDRLPIELP